MRNFKLLNERERASQFSFGARAKEQELILFDSEREAGDLWFFENWDMQFQDGVNVCLHDVLVGVNHNMKLLDIDGYRYFEFIDNEEYDGEYPDRFILRYPPFFDLDKIYKFYGIADDKIMALSTVVYQILVKLGVFD